MEFDKFIFFMDEIEKKYLIGMELRKIEYNKNQNGYFL